MKVDMPPRKIVDVANAINNAIAEGKTVTVDYPPHHLTIQIAELSQVGKVFVVSDGTSGLWVL
jgi:hypothetical protein